MSPSAGARYAIQQVSGAPPPTTPPVAGYVAWYDPSDAATITASGGAVSQLNDKSGGAHHLVQATGSKQPITGTRTQNGKNVLDFDGTDDALRVASWGSFAVTTSFVVALSDVGSNSASGRIHDGDTITQRVGKGATNLWSMSAGIQIGGGTPDTAAHVHTAIFNGNSSERLVDGATVGTVGNSGGTSLQGVTLGGDGGSGTAYWNGWIAEYVLYTSALNSTDRASVEAYLKAKWGTP